MNIYELNDEEINEDKIVEAMIETLERDTGNKVFTIRVVDRVKDKLESLIVFEDKSVLMGEISVEIIGGKMACRIKGNYI